MRKAIIFGVDGLTMPLLQRYVAQGALPNIARMLQQGSAAELLPFISAWGDVNWVTFLSGQSPGTSWIGQGVPPDNTASHNLLATLQNADKRAALVHFPESMDADGDHFSFAPYWGRAQAWPGEIFRPMGHTTRLEARLGQGGAKQQTLGWPPKSALAYHNKGAWQALEKNDEGYVLTLRGGHGDSLALALSVEQERPLLQLGEDRIALPVGQWSAWFSLAAYDIPGQVRFFCGECDDQGNIEILQSQVTRFDGLSDNASLASLLQQKSPFFSKWVAKAAPDTPYLAATWQEGDEQSQWLVDSSLELTQRQDFTLWATVHRLVDESHHNCLGQTDPDSPFFDAQQAEKYDAVMRRSYQILDTSIGRLLDETDDETLIMLASDHGAVPNSYMCDIYRYLQKHALAVLDEQGLPDMSHSPLYLKAERGGLEIFVNHDVVSLTEMDDICARAIQALSSWQVHTADGVRNAVSVALRRDDAVALGFWGDCAGDIVFAYNTGFVWGVSQNGEDICPVEEPGANHGPQKPTAETALGSNYGVMLVYGKGIRHGYYRNRQQRGPYRMTDPAATLAHWLGLKTSDLDGRIMSEIFDSPQERQS
ncbi:alkaline phosphatase family protein [Pantoea sp. EA-12]|uniref:alkaline phosphatase family protein n=1 Tax=Pantoea sp. EA-12 TaxID=3043303 RepID=UPI0024B55176|nr:alkaline phosphatase family protein [Pantoea sp. EA-12]MDI9221186.1 alkaline phosphatase family protein [Pantoea sp. EA-12]